MVRDWHEWHRAYDVPGSPLARRLELVQQRIRDALDRAPAGPIRVISMCAGDARDLLGALDGHPRRDDVQGRLVELDPALAAAAAARAPAGVEVLCADAGLASSYDGAVPADLVLVCGVFGNITDDDARGLISRLSTMCARDATVVWTRHRRPPDLTPELRRRFADNGFEELEFVAPDGFLFGIGVARFAGQPQLFRRDERLFEFVGFDALGEHCRNCGFSYELGRAEITMWLRADARSFVDRLQGISPARVRRRPAPDVWSPLEYACHVRDVLRVQQTRVVQAQAEDVPHFTPMRREERVAEHRYAEQDPHTVAAEIVAAADALASYLATLDGTGWSRRGVYNYPEPAERTVEWIGAHTVHELLHHRRDIDTSPRQ